MIKFVFLWTDLLWFGLLFFATIMAIRSRRQRHVVIAWRQVFQKPLGVVVAMILSVFALIGTLDSIHYRVQLASATPGESAHYGTEVKSVLDQLLSPLGKVYETSYSAPFALYGFSKTLVKNQAGEVARAYPRLQYAGVGITSDKARHWQIVKTIGESIVWGTFLFGVVGILLTLGLCYRWKIPWQAGSRKILKGNTTMPWRTFFITLWILIILLWTMGKLAGLYHIFGTDKVGQDIFYEAIKSIRTGLLIGTLTTFIMLPFAILFGISAGYFSGWVDDGIQYVYTTLSSIPGVLLIAAAILSLEVYMAQHPQFFETTAERADVRLLALCVILGVTSWTTLCRLLRGETLKVREMDYIQAANALGSPHQKIILRHILPNVMHIVLIAVTLDFSALVLAEAVLSYVGVGVDPTTFSWGNMINSARLELAREPIVWWPLLAAFIFMFILVLSANLFADIVRDAFDPRVKE